ncbi:hypothetical protein HDV00_009305 [Rhizophlyctis rosea]|nr:hypothetical protein HDV00_009305 [Rhizophlyctis rosea]
MNMEEHPSITACKTFLQSTPLATSFTHIDYTLFKPTTHPTKQTTNGITGLHSATAPATLPHKPSTRTIYAFHGTAEVNIARIFAEGFKIGGEEVPRAHGKDHGSGVYLAENPGLALSYASTHKLIVAVATVEEGDYDGSMVVIRSKERVWPVAVVSVRSGCPVWY